MSAAITIHFREPVLTAACIDSLLTDGWAPILVWDNSEDEGRSLQTLVTRYAGESRVRLVANPVNLGFGKGMNAALAKLARRGHTGPVLLINNDARVKPGMRDALHAQLHNIHGGALIAPRIQQGGVKQGWLYYQPWLALVTRHKLPGSFPYLSGCCLLVSREDNAQPLFDEDFFMYGEDVELSWRMRRKGAALVLLDQAWLEHEGSASSGQASETYERYLVHSHLLLARKLAGNAWVAGLQLTLRGPSLLARACLRAMRYRSWVPLRACTQFLNRSSSLPSDHMARR